MQILAVSNLEGIHGTTHENAQGSPALSGYELLFIRLFPGRHPMCVGDCTETLGAELLEVSVARSVLFLNAYIILDALQN
jgi:hypothetical protein